MASNYAGFYFALTDPRGPGTAYFHEYGHLIDAKMGNISNDDTLLLHILKDYKELDKKAIARTIQTDDKASSVSDLITGLSGGEWAGKYAHSSDYWKAENRVRFEFFAHFVESQFDNERRKLFEKTFPRAYNYTVELLDK